jgi:hypothetical protein
MRRVFSAVGKPNWDPTRRERYQSEMVVPLHLAADMSIIQCSRALATVWTLQALSLQESASVQAVIWVSLRALDLDLKPGEKIAWGNNLGVVYFRLPLHIADPMRRLQFVHDQIEKLKASPEPLLSNWLMSLFGFLVRLNFARSDVINLL